MPAVTGMTAGDDTTTSTTSATSTTSTTSTTSAAPVFQLDGVASPSATQVLDLDTVADATPVVRQSPPGLRTASDSAVQMWLDQGCYLFNLLMQDREKALCLASEMGRADIVANILAEQFDAGVVADASGNTPLMLAAKAGHVEVVEHLLQRGDVDVERRNAEGDSALVLAVAANHPNVVASLLRMGARSDPSPFADGMSLLAFAAGEGHLDIVKVLLAQPQAAVDAPCPAGGPLFVAASSDRVEVVAYLLGAGADCNRRRPNDHCTALISATLAGHVDVVRLLVAHDGIDLTLTEKNSSHTALGFAIIYCRYEMIECLLAADALLSRPAATGRPGLQMALQLKNVGMLEIFIRYGHIPQDADLDFSNPDKIDYVTVIADLSADRRLSGLMLPADERAASYFKEMFGAFDQRKDPQSELQWLRQQGMSMACARLVLDSLSRLPKILRPKGASVRLLDLFCMSALQPSSAPDVERRLTKAYRAAGISAPAVERLETRARWQLKHFSGLAKVALETTFDEMIDDLFTICVDKTGLTGQVRTDSLIARLCKNGFGKPVAEAIAASWCVGWTAVRAELLADVPSNSTVGMAMATTFAHITRCATTPFARDLQRRLGAGEGSAEGEALLGGQVDVILRPLLAFQCEALRQKCLTHIEKEASSKAQAPWQ